MNDYNFGNFLCMLREQKGMTQAEIAQLLNVTPAAVSKWENGESKPRTDTLFQLAEILGVTAQELIAGRYIEKESSDETEEEQEVKTNIMENVNRFLNFNVRIRRVFAFVLDMCLLSSFSFVAFFTAINTSIDGDSKITFFALVATVLSFFIGMLLFILRDFICKGKSLGKRLMGLIVIDNCTGDVAAKRQLAIRGLLHFISFMQLIDGAIMLSKGVSLGDHIAQTLVVSEKEWKEHKANPFEEVSKSSKAINKARIVVALICVGVVCASFFASMNIFFTNAILNSMKNTAQYTSAYNYIITSGIKKELSASTEDIKLKTFSINSSGSGETGTSTFGFNIKGKRITIISHLDRARWVVCEKCTNAGEVVCEEY